MEINNPYYHQFESNKQDWRIEAWLREHGVSARDLETHPFADDMVTLLNIRQELWYLMTQSERNVWGAYWGLVFVKQYPLNKKFWNKFTGITKSIDQRQQKQQLQKSIIKQLRTRKNKDHNSEAKGSDSSESNIHENGTTRVPGRVNAS